MIMVMTTLLLVTIFFLYFKRKNLGIVEYVYINEKTKIYHSEECPYAKNLKEVSLKVAIQNGYMPCKICNHKKEG